MSKWVRGLAWVTLAYGVAFGAGYGVLLAMPDAHPLLAAAAADVVATVVVFAIGTAFRNASFYDPYWSVLPMVLVLWMVGHPEAADGNGIRHGILVAVVWFWGARLTWNWARGWSGLDHVDWRYEKLRADNPRWYPLINLSGIHLFPTVLVFLGMMSVWEAAVSPAPLGVFDVVGGLLALAGGAIEAVADQQLRRYKASNPPPEAFISSGLWGWSRHPNYFGEQLFWVGLCVMALGLAPAANAYVVVGPLAMIALFTFISIPMMEKRMVAKRPAYAAYRARVSACIPLPPKSEAPSA